MTKSDHRLTKEQKGMSRRKKGTLALGSCFFIALGIGLFAFYQEGAFSPEAALNKSVVPPVSDFPRAVGGKITGGHFSLVDHKNRPVTDKTFSTGFMLIYFGYTHCPDVCPTGVQVMSEAIDALGDAGDVVQPLFITFDPKRDTLEVMADYMSNFHPRLLGLTGTKEQTLIAANSYDVDVSATYIAAPESEEGEEDYDRGYSMNHSAFTYLSGPDGRVRMMFRDGIGPEAMAANISRAIAKEPGFSGS
jgi:cytochrome oxidase Cu insertion factor (SCO1/SenC/PrrC family)